MATYPTATRNAQCNAVVDLIDGGAGAGKLEIGTSAMATTLVTLTFSDPAFGDAATGVATANAITTGTVANAGTAGEARIRTSADADVITGLTVSTSGANVNLSSLGLAAGDTVACSSMTVTQPAS